MTTYTYALRAPSVYNGPRFVSNTAIKRSVLTGAIQTISRPGSRWELDLTWENLYGDHREDVLAFFVRLNGAEHRVRLSALYGKTQRGAFGGSPVVDGAGQTGSSINLTGAFTGITDWIKAGDFLQIGNNLYQATADADSDGSGDVTVNIQPQLRSSPSNGASVTVESPYGQFILISPVDPSNVPGSSENPIISTLQLSFVEDVLA